MNLIDDICSATLHIVSVVQEN